MARQRTQRQTDLGVIVHKPMLHGAPRRPGNKGSGRLGHADRASLLNSEATAGENEPEDWGLMRRRLTRRIVETVGASIALTLAVVTPSLSASANDAVPPPEVESAFSCSASASVWLEADLCTQSVHFNAPRPVHLMNQAYIDGKSDDPVGQTDYWIAAAYGPNDQVLGTVAARPANDAWQLYPLDTREPLTTSSVTHPAADLVELRMTGDAFYAVENGTLLGLNQSAMAVAATPRPIADAQPDIAAAFARSSGGGGAVPATSAAAVPVIGFSVFAALVIGAFAVFGGRTRRGSRGAARAS